MRAHVKLATPWLFLVVIFMSGCFQHAPVSQNDTPANHRLFDSLLMKYVDKEGLVNYDGFRNDSLKFEAYLDELRKNPPGESWSPYDKLAYWINAYNAFSIKLILDYNPKHSIKDITNIYFPFVSSPWQIDFINIGDEVYNLDDIEYGIITKFDQPRTHLALMKASVSGPKLRQEAYWAETLNSQLNWQCMSFIRDEKRNELSGDHIRISRIFKWYESDFSSSGTIIDFINTYTNVRIEENATVDYLDYNWELNRQ